MIASIIVWLVLAIVGVASAGFWGFLGVCVLYVLYYALLHKPVPQPFVQVEQMEVGNRDRLALLLQKQMRGWEAADPTRVGPPQCLERGTEWICERATVPPALAQMIAKSAYRQIFHDKIDGRLGLLQAASWWSDIQKGSKRLGTYQQEADPMDRWWDDVDYEYACLYEKARECGALDTDFAQKFHGGSETGALVDASMRILANGEDYGELNFQKMTLTKEGSSPDLVRRVSAVQWELKADPELRKNAVEAMRLLVADPTTNAALRTTAQTFLDRWPEIPAWELFPEACIAQIENRYQMYLLRASRDV
jgi:hypothetical protein